MKSTSIIPIQPQLLPTVHLICTICFPQLLILAWRRRKDTENNKLSMKNGSEKEVLSQLSKISSRIGIRY